MSVLSILNNNNICGSMSTFNCSLIELKVVKFIYLISLLHLSTRNCIIALPELNKPEMYIIYPHRNTDSVLNKYIHSSFIMNVY